MAPPITDRKKTFLSPTESERNAPPHYKWTRLASFLFKIGNDTPITCFVWRLLWVFFVLFSIEALFLHA